MRNLLRRWLGFNDLLSGQRTIQGQLALTQRLVAENNNKISAYALGVGRIIAKLEPLYGVPEDDPVRKEFSDALADAVIKRLEGEHKAQHHHEGGA